MINMRVTQKEDIQFVVSAEQDHENAQYVGQWSYEQHLNAITDPDILHIIFTDNANKNIGYAIIKGIVNQNNSIELMRIVITDKGKSYGKNALSLIKKYVFETLNAHRLWLDVREENFRAQHIYEIQGFTKEGLLRECVKADNA